LRWVVTGVAIYYAYFLYTVYTEKVAWFWGLVIVAILFNPIAPIYLYNKGLWNIIDVVVAVFLISLIFNIKKK
jgi:arginine exporter protein ArgO